MKYAALLIVLLLTMLPLGAETINAEPAPFTAEDLAESMDLKQKTFTIEYDALPERVEYRIDFYRDGKVVERGFLSMTRGVNLKLKERLVLVYNTPSSLDQDRNVRVSIRAGSGQMITEGKLRSDEALTATSTRIEFDEQNRMVLAYAPNDPAESEVNMLTKKSSTPEGAYCALVLQIEPEYAETES